MLGNTFSHGLFRDYVVAFGTLFNNIKINRRAASGESASTIAVPLMYAPRQRYIERVVEDLNLDKPVALALPGMSFELMSINYGTERKINTMQRHVGFKSSSNTQLLATYAPVPYDFTFQLNIFIRNIEDGTHIIEQILPYFTPEFTVSLKSATDLGFNMDLPIILNAVNMEDSYEGGFDERRFIIWTLDFTLKGNLFGPITDSGLINKAFVRIHPHMDESNANNFEQIISQPAMFANGSPTTESRFSVDPNLITANSDYGISQDIYSSEESANNHKLWTFSSPIYSTSSFGPAVGNTTFDGWETYEGADTANGTVDLSIVNGVLRHTIVKDESVVDDVQEIVYLQIFSNTAATTFESFYGKKFQSVSLRYKIKQTNGSGGVHNYLGKLRWMTTNTDEDQGFSTGTVVRYRTAPRPSEITDTGVHDTFYTVEWDMADNAYWDDRIITALRIELLLAADTSGPSTIATDIDYIKIHANTG